MASTDWIEVYRSYTAEELEAEIAQLKKFSDPLTSQTAGENAWTKDPGQIGSRLASAVRVKAERGPGCCGVAVGRASFSNLGGLA